MVGNPFSPYYARARRQGAAPAIDFSSMNVAVYERRSSTSRGWSFDERPIRHADRQPRGIEIGHSTMYWEPDRLIVDLDERTTPAPFHNPLRRPIRGRVTVHPEAQPELVFSLDPQDRHRWWPVAPLARIEVNLEAPRLRFSGHGYHDANAGDVCLESTFESWSWSRARLDRGACLTYDVTRRGGHGLSHAFVVGKGGAVEPLTGLRKERLGRSAWGLERHAQVDGRHPARIVRSLEDGPFYSRTLMESRVRGEATVAVHETLAAHRLRRRWVRFCTACRMRRSR